MTALVQWLNDVKTDFLGLFLISSKMAVITPGIISMCEEGKRDKGKLVSYLIVEGYFCVRLGIKQGCPISPSYLVFC